MGKPDEKTSYNQLFRRGVDLTEFNTMGVTVEASRFVKISTKKQLKEFSNRGFFDREDWLLLGGGSNLLFKSDLNRPVLHMGITGTKILDESDGNIKIQFGAGEEWHRVVEWAVHKNYGGIENLALIPGTAGAAPIQNIGAYGVELADVFYELDYFNTETNLFQTLTKEECSFGYRDSIFKHELKKKGIIISVTLNLSKKNHSVNSTYASLKSHLRMKGVESPAIKDIFDAVVAIRKSKLPDPRLYGNAGSFFKNPITDKDFYYQLKERYPDMPSYQLKDGNVKIPAGWLIDRAGWKGKKAGNVGCFENQALVIVNYGGATGKEVAAFAKKVQASVKQNFGIDLVPEVNIIES